MKKMIVALLFVVFWIEGSVCIASSPDDMDSAAIGVSAIPFAAIYDSLKKDGVKVPIRSGMIVVRVVPGSPAERAKIKVNDIILKVRGKSFRDTKTFIEVIGGLNVGKEYSFTGYSHFQIRGKSVWKKGTVKITPVTKREVILGVLAKETDKVNDVTFYQHVNSPLHVNSRSEIYCYIVKPGEGKPYLRIKTQYVANDWLFVREISIKADDKKFVWDMSRFNDVERDNSGGKIWEWQDKTATEKEIENLKLIAKALEVTIRYKGSQYRKDREMGDNEKARLGEVLRAYQVLVNDSEKKSK